MALIEALFMDNGGVLMTNGWDHTLRKKTAETFGIDYEEMDTRHRMIFEFYETGKMTFDEYLKWTVFFERRVFSLQDVKQFVFDAVRPYDEMIDFIKRMRKEHNLKIIMTSNEGRELAVDRIRRFNLKSFFDFFVVSSFVGCRKPDPELYRYAIDLSQIEPSKIVYIDDRPLLIEVGKSLGLRGIHHKSVESTESALNLLLSEASVR